jgi:hypothetical protein
LRIQKRVLDVHSSQDVSVSEYSESPRLHGDIEKTPRHRTTHTPSECRSISTFPLDHYPTPYTMPISAIFPNPPDPTSRQPFTPAAFLPLCTCNYILAVLAILPHTYILRLALVPVILWQAWNCAVGLDFSAALARSAGHNSVDKLNHHNFAYGVRDPFCRNELSPTFFC